MVSQRILRQPLQLQRSQMVMNREMVKALKTLYKTLLTININCMEMIQSQPKTYVHVHITHIAQIIDRRQLIVGYTQHK